MSVTGVLSRQGNDLSDLITRYAEAAGCDAVGLLAGLISESDLDEQAARRGVWPDVSFGLGQQTVAYAPVGTQANTAANIAFVRDYYWQPEHAIAEAARQYGAYYRRYGDYFEAWSRYNGGAGMAFASNPNRANIQRGWDAAQAYRTADPPADGALVERWIAAMEALTGTPYVFGGKDIGRDGGLDCSGLITSTAQRVGLNLGAPDATSADGLKQYGDPVDAPQRGDLVLFHSTYGTGGRDYATHVGVHLHDTVMIDTHNGVHETDYGGPYWQQHLMGFWHPQGLASGGDDLSAEERAELGRLRSEVSSYEDDTFTPLAATMDALLAHPPAKAELLAQLAAMRNSIRTNVGI